MLEWRHRRHAAKISCGKSPVTGERLVPIFFACDLKTKGTCTWPTPSDDATVRVSKGHKEWLSAGSDTLATVWKTPIQFENKHSLLGGQARRFCDGQMAVLTCKSGQVIKNNQINSGNLISLFKTVSCDKKCLLFFSDMCRTGSVKNRLD